MQLTNFSKELDAILNTLEKLQPSAETTLAKRSLQRAFSWTGEALKAGGSPSPYTESQNYKSDVLYSVAEHDDSNIIPWPEDMPDTQVAKVKFLRFKIQECIGKAAIKNLGDFLASSKAWQKESENEKAVFIELQSDCMKQVSISLKDAKIWLGWELDRLSKA
jgi:flagellar hook-basal body complex protein FliE